MMNLLVFDFGGTSVKYTLWQEDKILDVSNFLTPKTWEQTKEKILEVKGSYEKKYQLSGAAFSFPGSVDHENGEILGNSAIKYIHHFPIQKEISDLLGLPVAMENDANCAALAEVWTGGAKGAKDVLFVVVGTGIGGAIVTNGKVQTGAHLYGGEFGFAYLNYEGESGKRSFSELGTAVYMAKRYCDSIGVPHDTHSGEDVFSFAEEGDKNAIREVEVFFRYLSIGLFNLQLSFDPEVIVIGGGISASDEIIVELEARVNDLIKSVGIKDFKTRLLPCFYKNDANLIGAVKNYYDRVGWGRKNPFKKRLSIQL